MKKGYFYTLDAVLAVLILIIGLMMIAGFYFYAPQKEKGDELTNDVVNIMATVKVSDICENTQPCDCEHYPSLENPDICRFLEPDYTLMEDFGMLYHKNRRSTINDTITQLFVVPGIRPNNYEMQVLLTDGPDTHQIFPLIEQ